MSVETFLLITTIIGTFVGSVIGGVIASTRANAKVEKRVSEQSQTLKAIKDDTEAVDKRVKELEADKALLEEARASRDRRIDKLEDDVRQLTDEKAEVVRERNALQTKLLKAEGEISNLNIRIIKLEAQVEAEKNASNRIVQPIVDALARLAVQPHTSDTGKLNPAALDHAPDAGDGERVA